MRLFTPKLIASLRCCLQTEPPHDRQSCALSGRLGFVLTLPPSPAATIQPAASELLVTVYVFNSIHVSARDLIKPASEEALGGFAFADHGRAPLGFWLVFD